MLLLLQKTGQSPTYQHLQARHAPFNLETAETTNFLLNSPTISATKFSTSSRTLSCLFLEMFIAGLLGGNI